MQIATGDQVSDALERVREALDDLRAIVRARKAELRRWSVA